MEEENKKEDLQEQTIEQDDSFIEENTANLVEDSLDANDLPLKENIVEQVADDEIFIEEAQQNNVDFEHVVSPKVPKTSKNHKPNPIKTNKQTKNHTHNHPGRTREAEAEQE